MGLFSSSTSYLGVDIGTSSIKIVELENFKNQARLKTYGYADAAVNVLGGDIEQNNEKIARYINEITKKANTQTRSAVAALPTFSVFNFIINLPPMPKKDLASAIKWEAKKFIPVPLEETILDWKIIGAKRKSQGLKKDKKEADKKNGDIQSDSAGKANVKQDEQNYRILLTAAPKNLVARYIDIFKRAKLNLLSLETESFALARSLLGNDRSTVMIVDVGSTTTDICIIEEGVPIINQGLDMGGESITTTIMNSLNVSKDRAEQFKRDFGLSLAGGDQKIPDVIKKSLDAIINEIRYVFDRYHKQDTGSIEKIILTGGSSFLPNFPQYLSELLNISVIIGDPWDRIIYPLDLKPILDEMGPRMSVCLGLAMRDIF
ncbi:MAG: pilus assembly protein PilM [Patescibacteria group bacterium]|nr:pilus assembly protein PilM [Patescibacteria group bacterium]